MDLDPGEAPLSSAAPLPALAQLLPVLQVDEGSGLVDVVDELLEERGGQDRGVRNAGA